MLTDLELRRAIDQFRATHTTRTPTDELLPSWRILRKSLDAAQFTLGCRRYVADGSTYFPVPSDLKRLALEERAYSPPPFYSDSLEDDVEPPPFDRDEFRERLRRLSGIDLDGPPPILGRR